MSSTTSSTTTTPIIGALPVTPIGRRYLNLYQLQKYCDCSFQIDDIIIKCHKLILSSASPVFDAMFYGPMSSSSTDKDKDDKNDDNNCINKIVDINPDTFQILIEYIYCGEIDFKKLTLETIIELYYSGEKYLINELIIDCLKEIKKKLDYKNILQTLDLCIYIGLQPLLKILLNYFEKLCLSTTYSGNYQFMNILETNYYHISRDCLKLIIDNLIKDNDGNLTGIWFIQYWCKKECKILGLNENDYMKLLKDFDLKTIDFENSNFNDKLKTNNQLLSIKNKISIPNYLERQYFKALRPIVITENFNKFSTKIITDRFITLLGFTMHGRIIPKVFTTSTSSSSSSAFNNDYNNFNDHYYCGQYQQQQNQTYTESFDIHIWSNNCVLIHRQNVILKNLNYNCDLNITLLKNIILSSGFEYEIKIIWNDQSYGAEYPCSLYSNQVKGITFVDDGYNDDDSSSSSNSNSSYDDDDDDEDDSDDQNNSRDNANNHNRTEFNIHEGGIIKGIRYLNQI